MKGKSSRKRVRWGGVLVAATALFTIMGTTAMAAGNWAAADLTAIAGAPPAASAPVGFTTNLSGQGPVARVVYRTRTGHVEQLYLAGGGTWKKADLTAIAGAPVAASAPFGFTTSLSGQGPVARVVYKTTPGHIEQLYLSGGGTWKKADLTAIAGGTIAVSAPFGFVTNLTGQGPVARVVYRGGSTGADIEELRLSGGGTWAAEDLSAMAGAPPATSAAVGYTTNLAGQGPLARVVYQTSAAHVEELSLAGGGTWKKSDLSATTGAPDTAGVPFGFATNLTGQGPTARVVYRTTPGHIEGLSLVGGGTWKKADLTAMAVAPTAILDPVGFTTNLTGQGPVARVLYKSTTGQVEQLYVGGGGSWAAADLTAIAGAPATLSPPFGFTTNLTGQGPVVRVVYTTFPGQVEQLYLS